MLDEIAPLVEAGASIIWLHERSKAPIGNDWSSRPTKTLTQLEKAYRDGNNVGIRLGKWSEIDGEFLHAIDIDIRDPDLAGEAWAELKRLFKGVRLQRHPIVISGSGGESRHIYFTTDKPFSSKKLARSDEKIVGKDGKEHWAWEIELFGSGKQVALPPSIHPDTGKPYRWLNEVDFDLALPHIDVDLVEALLADDGEEGDSEIIGISLDEARDFILDLPLDKWCDDRDGWRNVGMALRHEFGNSRAAYEVWCEFSKQSKKFDPEVQRQQWKSFKGKTDRPVRMATIMAAAREARILGAFDQDSEVERVKKENVDGDAPDRTITMQSDRTAPHFPIKVFGPIWSKRLKVMANNAGAPTDYTSAAALSVTAALLGNARWVQAHKYWKEPPVLWCMVIGPPSANKSPAVGPFMGALNDLENMWFGPFAEQKKQWEAKKKTADGLRKKWEVMCQTALERGEEQPDMPAGCDIGPEPKRRRAFVTDATIEALMRVLAVNPRGLLNFRDEMAGWFANLSRYTNGSDRPIWLEAYGGRPYVIDRVKDDGEPVRVERFSVGILGGLQPDRLTDMLDTADDGLVPRFLPFWPEEYGMKFVREPEDVGRIIEPLQRLSELAPQKDGSPVMVPLSKEATDLFERWKNARALSERFVNSQLQAVFGKADGHVLRLALVIEFMKWSADEFEEDEPTEISAESMKGAIHLRDEYFKPMQLRVFGHASRTPESKLAKSIAEWIVHNRIEQFNVRQMRRGAGIPGLTGKTEVERIEEALNYLVDLKWLYPVEVKGKNGRPRKDYEVNERLWSMLD